MSLLFQRMSRWAAWLLAPAGVLLFLDPVSAQVSRRLQACSPYSQPANDPSSEITGIETPRPPRIIVDDVTFDGPPLPGEIQTQITQLVKQIRKRAWPGWIEEVGEVVVRGTLQDEGYYHVEEKTEAQVISSDPAFQHVSITLHIDLGLEYRLGSVAFRSADPTQSLVFPADELRKLVPLSEGELFSGEKIREGLDNLRKLYGSKGYYDFTATPLIQADDAKQRISLVMELDEQKQFRIGKVKVISLDPKIQPILDSEFKPGDIFNSQAIEEFFQENKSALPPDASPEDMGVERTDVSAGIVDLRFILLTCSQFRSTLDP